MGLSYTQKVLLAVLPKISGVFSIFGSMWIIIEVATNKNKRGVPYHRLLLMMSAYDVLESCASFFSTWAIPKGSPDIIWASGNDATCTAQGFLLQLTLAVPLYNAMLSIYYMLVINYQYTDAKLKSFVEPAMHIFCFAWPFGTGVYSAVTKQINNADLWCWLAPLPAGCLDSWDFGTVEQGNPNPCIRGDNIWAYRFGFYFIPLWISIFTATFCTYTVWKYVHRQDRAVLDYRQPERKRADNFSLPLKADDESKILPALPDVTTSDSGQDVNLDKNKNVKESTSADASGLQNRQKAATEDSEESMGLGSSLETSSPKTGQGSELQQLKTSDAWSITMKNALEQASDDEEDSVEMAAAEEAQQKSHRRTLLGVFVKNPLATWRERRVRYAQDMPHAHKVLHQACFFLGVFYLTHVWSTSNRIIQAVSGESMFPILLLHSFFDPLQGLLNYFVYQRPRYLKLRRLNPDMSRLSILAKLLRFSFMDTEDSMRTKSGSPYSQVRSIN